MDRAGDLKYHVLYEDRQHRGRKAILLSRRETAQEAMIDCEKWFKAMAAQEGKGSKQFIR
jgi:hypothetical protein